MSIAKKKKKHDFRKKTFVGKIKTLLGVLDFGYKFPSPNLTLSGDYFAHGKDFDLADVFSALRILVL